MFNPKGFVLITINLCILLLISGCTVTRTQNEVHYSAELPSVEKVDLNVELRLTDDFRTSQLVYKDQGSTFYSPLGNSLSKNAETIARKAFAKIIISNENSNFPPSNGNLDAILIPQVVTVKRDRPLTIFSTQTTTLHLVWTLNKPDNSLLWTTTIEAVGEGPMGTFFTDRNAGAKQIRNLLQDASEKSLDKLVSSSIIRQYAQLINQVNN